jgi:hypothetical protein
MHHQIPKMMEEKYSSITTLTDAFCAKHLNEEYQQMIHKAAGVLARKRPSPLLKGKDGSWAAGLVHAVGSANFLFDRSQEPHCKPKFIYDFFGVAESTGQIKSKEIRDLLKMDFFSHEWTLPSKMDSNSMVWMLKVNGFYVDIRMMPLEAQQQAFAQGLIPYVPALKTLDNQS